MVFAVGKNICDNWHKRYVRIVNLSVQDNAKLVEQLKPGFKRRIDWNKFQSKVSTERQNQYLDLIDPNFHGVNRLFALLFQNENDRKVHTIYYLPKVELKDYIVITGEKNFLDQPGKSHVRTYDNNWEIATG